MSRAPCVNVVATDTDMMQWRVMVNICVQSSLIHDVPAAVAENTNNGARGNVTSCGRDVTSQRAAAAATANSREELNTSTSSCTSRSSVDADAKSPGNHTLFTSDTDREFQTQLTIWLRDFMFISQLEHSLSQRHEMRFSAYC